MNKKAKEKITATAVTAMVSASALVGGLFASPSDLLDDSDASIQTEVMQSVDDDDAGVEEIDEDLQRRRGGVRAKLRQWVWELPVGVRAIVGVPLWCLGWVILTGLSTLWGALLSPIVGTLAGWLCLAALLIGVFALTMKTMFPDMPMKKILRKRNVLIIVAGVAVLGIADTVLPYAWDAYETVADIARLTGSFVIVLAVVWVVAVRENRARQKAAAEEPIEDTQAEFRRKVLEMADSVR